MVSWKRRRILLPCWPITLAGECLTLCLRGKRPCPLQLLEKICLSCPCGVPSTQALAQKLRFAGMKARFLQHTRHVSHAINGVKSFPSLSVVLNESYLFLFFVVALAVNEGRMRVQEVGSRATSGQVSEGQLRAMEAHAAAEKRAASFSTTSEARQRLQEGSKPTAAAATSSAVKIPVRTASATNVASSVPTKKSAASIEVSNSVSSTSNVPSNRHVRNSSGTIMKSAIPVSNQNANTETSNPFGSDEDEDYDQTKNPFADDEVSANPFGTDDDYNDALNPFAE